MALVILRKHGVGRTYVGRPTPLADWHNYRSKSLDMTRRDSLLGQGDYEADTSGNASVLIYPGDAKT